MNRHPRSQDVPTPSPQGHTGGARVSTHECPQTRVGKSTSTLHGVAVTEPTYADLRARLLLAQSLISHRLDTDSPDVAAVLAVLRGDLALAGDD